MTDSLFRLSPGRQGARPIYTPPADKGRVCMHSGELVSSPTWGASAVRPRVYPHTAPRKVEGAVTITPAPAPKPAE